MRFIVRSDPAGLTLIDALVGIAIFVIISNGIFSVYTNLSRGNKLASLKANMAAAGRQYLEIARNLSYQDVGVSGGLPAGSLPPSQTVWRGSNEFQVNYSVRSIDDPFDGTINGSPRDLSPADYKQVTVTVSCLNCASQTPPPTEFSTIIAPKNLETSSTNGALFIQVLNANGQPVPQASIHIENNTVIPAVNLNETSNNSGWLQLVDVPPAEESYRIIVTKTGYSTDQTYSPTDPSVLHPIKTDATVLVQQVTQISFSIDRVSQLNIASINSSCSAVPNVAFNLQGSKLIGLNPNTYKYNQNLSTDAAGLRNLTNLEWDTYNLSLTDPNYDNHGFIPLPPINLAPNSTQDLKIVVGSAAPHSLLVVVKDSGTHLPLSDASVHLTKANFDQTILTSRGYWRQTSWKDGPGQTNWLNEEMYFSDDGNIEANNPVGEIKLKKSGHTYATAGSLISSTFDTGSPTNFATIEWQPGDQPPATGATPVKFQIATNNDNLTWNFLGPDGTAGTYYTAPGQTISPAHNGNRYIRYKTYLSTNDTGYTPNLSDISLTYVSACVPPGQAFFSHLTSTTYTLEVSLPNYQTYTGEIDLSPNWTTTEVNLLPL